MTTAEALAQLRQHKMIVSLDGDQALVMHGLMALGMLVVQGKVMPAADLTRDVRALIAKHIGQERVEQMAEMMSAQIADLKRAANAHD